MRTAYPAFIAKHNNTFLVYVPDMDIYTEGTDLPDAIYMARDAIGLKGIDFEDENRPFPVPSSLEDAMKTAESNTDIFDYSKGILTLVDIDFTEYRRRLYTKSVKKNCTIPYWLNIEAEKQGINFSRVLQDALIQILGISRPAPRK